MKVIVVGPISEGDREQIKTVQGWIREAGYEVIDQLVFFDVEKDDFRGSTREASLIVHQDLDLIDQADVLVVLATRPSFGVGSEIMHAVHKGKKIIVLAPEPLRSPWPVGLSNVLISELSKEKLIFELKKIEELLKSP